MSIDINWEAATSGPDGDALAEQIRSFIHDKFQQVALPRFIRSVEVTAFDFGTVSPELEIRDICDPLSDFYEEDDEDDDLSDDDESEAPDSSLNHHQASRNEGNRGDARRRDSQDTLEAHPLGGGSHTRRSSAHSRDESSGLRPFRSSIAFGEPLNPYFFPRSNTPGISGGTSNLGYYYMPLGGLSGTQTPLNPVGRGRFSDAWGHTHAASHDIPPRRRASRRHSDIEIDSGQSRPSTADTMGSLHPGSDLDPQSQFRSTQTHGETATEDTDDASASIPPLQDDLPPRRMRERKPDDLQVFCRIRYAGDIKLSLTAQILLDYPMPSFVGLPLNLNITGVTFDGVAVIAYIRKRVHLCFLSPADAAGLLGGEEDSESRPTSSGDYFSRRKGDGLLRNIKVESEIGRKESGKQVLKNVGKVEKFVLEQVRRIFEEEFVYPSFWTFLV